MEEQDMSITTDDLDVGQILDREGADSKSQKPHSPYDKVT